jgi:uncharacterized CHY-type Zn-finger protein
MADESFIQDIEMEDSDDDLDDGNDFSNNMLPDYASPPAPEPNEEDAAIARRRAIQAIMRDTTLSEEGRRMQIQNLMSGGRSEVAAQTAPVIPEYESNTCVHYERNCNIIAPCCDRIFGCRICHDEISPSGHANMNRFLIKQVVCKKCNTKQDARYVASMSPQISCLQTILPTFASFIVIFVFNVEQSLLNTIATLATSGWRVPKNLSIAMSAAFAALAASNPFDIAKSAACASQ